MPKIIGMMLAFVTVGLGAPDDDLILKHWLLYSDAANSLYHRLCQQAFHYLDLREAAISRIQNQKDWQGYQETTRGVMEEAIGPFPQKTDLKPQITGRYPKEGYTIEKVIFQSQPNFYVTACLFLPNTKGKHPAIVYCSGHSIEGFRLAVYLRPILNLVKKGFVVLAFDPVGQGERLQYYDPQTQKSAVGGPTREHSYAGAQCFLAGYSPAVYWIWDGIRVVDYLVSRPEVDPKRIGITGRSGGGTQSAYIAAFDERIVAAAPECYITSFRRLLQSVGPQDTEQIFYHGIAKGLDMADLLLLRAPKPALVISTTRDYFSIQGARETVAQVSAIYRLLGSAESLQMVEDDSVHASTQKNREAMYGFFQKFLHQPGSASEQDIRLPSLTELTVTPIGQVAGLKSPETIHSLNTKIVRVKSEALNHSRTGREGWPQLCEAAKTLAGFSAPLADGELVFTGRQKKAGCVWEKYFLQFEKSALPFLRLVREGSPDPAANVIFLHPEGKAALVQEEKNWRPFLEQDYAVIWPDLSGIGELGGGSLKGDSYDFLQGKGEYNLWFGAIQLGKSLVGIQAEELLSLAHHLQTWKKDGQQAVSAVAFAQMAPVLLHSAAFDSVLGHVGLINAYVDYVDLAVRLYYKPEYMCSAVAGSVGRYDLQDLAALIAPRPLTWLNGCDTNGQPLSQEQCEQQWEYVRQVYQACDMAHRLQIKNNLQQTAGQVIIDSWR